MCQRRYTIVVRGKRDYSVGVNFKLLVTVKNVTRNFFMAQGVHKCIKIVSCFCFIRARRHAGNIERYCISLTMWRN